jgi:Fic-DOC domain mobile mystery protein B
MMTPRALRLTYISTRGELDAAEQANIVRGRAWALNQRLTVVSILDDASLRRLHNRMFGEVWGWAGIYRRSNKNIGIDWPGIAEGVRNLCGDAKLWFAAADGGDDPSSTGKGSRGLDAAAVELHHRLVSIHAFSNGNGRHARLTADLLARASGATPFTWGEATEAMLTAGGDPVRAAYLASLRAADAGDIQPLVDFARS